MARARSPNRERALEIWLKHSGEISNRKLAEMLGEKEKTISNWKSRDKWNVVLQTGERSTTKKESKTPGAPKGNKNAVGNEGGAPKRNTNAVKHGFFQKYFPEETMEIMEQVSDHSPLDLLWDQITIQYTAIVRAQRIMFVEGKHDETKVLKRQRMSDTMTEVEYELQHAWDKQATFLQAQSRAMSTLQSLIRQYEDLCRVGSADEERQLKLKKLKGEISLIDRKLNGEDHADTADDGFIEALKGRAKEVWTDET
ncbi:phage terminase small subunit [Paenibacillus larvae]|uniref:Phage-related terminase-like protein small subunit n=1 Tax=Paenibacillus larvae subsp. larvae TaxID=147375 RepID=A0A6C0QU73_9BACL|nr:phage terminase small subunit [Paenibacillus larvae]QHZ52170.1 phage-related terminase-like protein small subunit [Paenibacillus larvae subsp. larvae]